MSSRATNCPNCGGQVEFKAGTSLLTVCPYCSSAVARLGDDITELEILGRVAPLADLGSPLAIGVDGRYDGRAFTLVGRAQYNYGLGPWNEWYAAFDDATWAWIAEAQGRVYITFREDGTGLPAYAEAWVGSHFRHGENQFTVTERRRAKFVAGEGELPFAIRPDAYVYYCDVEGRGGTFGTLDYGDSAGAEPESLFVGHQVEYADLFDRSLLKDVAPGQAAAAAAMNCPNCGAAVELRAPDEAQRVTCGACDSLLDCGPGQTLSLLNAATRRGPEPKISLGATGELNGRKWTVYGHLTRSVTYEGIRYPWQEYLLRGEQGGGYRWLTESDGHWSWVDPVHAGDVSGTGRVAVFIDEQFRHYQSSTATVDHLRGEFYWKVSVGEQVGLMDFIRPPRVLSREAGADEVNWSVGTYIDKAEIERGFRLGAPLPWPRGVSPHQPNPHRAPLDRMLRLGLIFTGLLCLFAVFMSLTSDDAIVLQERVTLSTPRSAPAIVKGEDVKRTFKIPSSGNLAITVTSDVRNTWLFVGGRLIDETLGRTRDFGVQVTYHTGYTGGESWASGGRRRTVFLGSVPAGEYTVVMKPEWSGQGRPPSRFDVAIRSQVFIGTHAVVFGFLLWVLPLIQAIVYYTFEKRRWAESDYA